MTQDPLEEDLALARAALNRRSPAIDPQRKARLWSEIDRQIQGPEARSFHGGWLLFAGAVAAAAAIVAMVYAPRPEVKPEVAANVAPSVEKMIEPAPVEKKTRWIAERPETLTIDGAELRLAEGTELVLLDSGVYEVISGSVEVKLDSGETKVFAAQRGKLSTFSAKFSPATLPSSPEPVSARMDRADRERLAGKTERAIVLYEKVVRDAGAGEYREEAILRLAELHAASGRSEKALEELAQADARIKHSLLIPERTALAVELLIAADRLEEAASLLERTHTIESPALDRARALLEEKKKSSR
jgi:tetratricopeptide (TPR) repeat protein